ncbi:MAG: hypothetical protein JXR37_07980 [Kiritimatiellae bacterium]|nr:hypothetical protein [Kiritimatiellia bacterium]
MRDDEVTMAAVLLVGHSASLSRWIPQHELVFIRYTSRTRYEDRRNLRAPIVMMLDTLQRLLETHVRLALVETEGFGEIAAPDLSWRVVREAVLNGLVHRDYFQRQSVYVELRPGCIDVVSPGGLIGGVTPENILRHAPARKNPLLAAALEISGFVNRAGMGVDRMYEGLLRLGKGLPRYQADESSVRLSTARRKYAYVSVFAPGSTKCSPTQIL